MRNEAIAIQGQADGIVAKAFFNTRYGDKIRFKNNPTWEPFSHVGVINGIFSYFTISDIQKSDCKVRIFNRMPLKVGDYVEVTGDGGHNSKHIWSSLSKHGIRKGEKHVIQDVDYQDDGFGDYTVKINDCPYRADYLKLIDNVSVTLKFRTITYKQAQEIIDMACPEWKNKLFVVWGQQIVLKQDIQVTDEWYKTMRKSCTQQQHMVFDRIFGKDKKFKIGDWVTWTGIETLTAQIIREGANIGGACWVLNEKTHNSCHEDNLRLATEEEIQKIKYIPEGTPCLVRDEENQVFRLYYATGNGKFYFMGKKKHETHVEWKIAVRLDKIHVLDLSE